MATKKSESMISYAAFLRGIGPGDPKKSNESLRKLFESCGFSNVRSFISSGNILFESKEADVQKLERKAEKAFRDTHGIEVATFIRSKEDLELFLSKSPFGKRTHSPQSYLIVTFLKEKQATKALAPLLKDPKSGLLSFDAELNAVCSVVNTSGAKTPDFMVKLEKLLSKEITTRTLNTVERVTKRL
jgi:uncharacterized protein (DUF1697 family)